MFLTRSFVLFSLLTLCLPFHSSFAVIITQANTEAFKKELLQSIGPKNRRESYFPRDLLTSLTVNKFPPVVKKTVGDYHFYFSLPLIAQKIDPSRRYYILYSQSTRKPIATRAILVYRSKSAGVPRVALAIGDDFHLWNTAHQKNKSGRFKPTSQHHYTQETLLIPELADLILEMEEATKGEAIQIRASDLVFFQQQVQETHGLLDFRKETLFFQPKLSSPEAQFLHEYQRYKPGHNKRVLTQLEKQNRSQPGPKSPLGKIPNLERYFENLEIDPRFEPDWKNPVRTFLSNHALLSRTPYSRDIGVHEYRITFAGLPTIIQFSTTQNGRIWVSSFYFEQAPVNSFGVRRIVIDSGSLTNKPIEYHRQIPGTENQNRVLKVAQAREYIFFTHFLDRMPLIQAYRKFWKIPKNYLDKDNIQVLDLDDIFKSDDDDSENENK